MKPEKDKDIQDLVEKYFKPKSPFVPGETPIGMADAQYNELELYSLVEAALNWKVVDGERSHALEIELAKFMGTRYSTFCNSGSSANLLAFMCLTSPKLGSRAIQPGDEVITCAVGFPTTVAPIIQAGAIPVFVDVSLSTYNPTPVMISNAITDKTKAIFLAHTLGNPFDVEAIKEIASQNGLWLIEDCCDALGSQFDGKNVGTFGDVSTTSFYPAHMMTTGEGGMVFTDSPMLNQIIRSLRDWGRECWCLPNKDNTCGKRFAWTGKGELPDCFDHKYIYSHVGYNLKSTDLQASIGLEQIKKLPTFIETRRHNWRYLNVLLEFNKLDRAFILPSHHPKANPAWFGFLLTVKDDVGFTRAELIQFLNENKIATRNLFAGNLMKQPGFLKKGYAPEETFKADIVMNRTFWVGCHAGMTDEMVEYTVSKLVEFVKSHE